MEIVTLTKRRRLTVTAYTMSIQYQWSQLGDHGFVLIEILSIDLHLTKNVSNMIVFSRYSQWCSQFNQSKKNAVLCNSIFFFLSFSKKTVTIVVSTQCLSVSIFLVTYSNFFEMQSSEVVFPLYFPVSRIFVVERKLMFNW